MGAGGQASQEFCVVHTLPLPPPPPPPDNLSKLTDVNFTWRGVDSVYDIQFNLENKTDFNPLQMKSKNKQP